MMGLIMGHSKLGREGEVRVHSTLVWPRWTIYFVFTIFFKGSVLKKIERFKKIQRFKKRRIYRFFNGNVLKNFRRFKKLQRFKKTFFLNIDFL